MRGKYMRKLICCMLVAMMGVTQLCSVVSQAADISGLGFRVPASHCFDFGSGPVGGPEEPDSSVLWNRPVRSNNDYDHKCG